MTGSCRTRSRWSCSSGRPNAIALQGLIARRGKLWDGRVILLPADFGRFFRQHETATLICYDAAMLHWLLEGHFRQTNDAQSSKTLWAYSAESRLIDIMLLDQHIRRCRGEDGTVASPLHRLVRRVRRWSCPTTRKSSTGLPPSGRKWRRGGARMLLCSISCRRSRRVSSCAYEHLVTEAKSIEEAVEASQLPPIRMPTLSPAEERNRITDPKTPGDNTISPPE